MPVIVLEVVWWVFIKLLSGRRQRELCDNIIFTDRRKYNSRESLWVRNELSWLLQSKDDKTVCSYQWWYKRTVDLLPIKHSLNFRCFSLPSIQFDLTLNELELKSNCMEKTYSCYWVHSNINWALVLGLYFTWRLTHGNSTSHSAWREELI